MDFTYPVNVRFECNKCGLCCGDTKEKSRHILLLESEAKRIASHTSMPLTDFSKKIDDKFPYCYEMKKTEEGKCVFLRDNGCIIYQVRPLICMFYPFELKFDNGRVLHVFDFTNECPAMGAGKIFDEIDFERLFDLARQRLLKVAGGHQAAQG